MWSPKQQALLSWWHDDSPVKDAVGIISEGSIRSGKTMAGVFSFVDWAFHNFDNQHFAFTGKTVGSIRRNIIRSTWFFPYLKAAGYQIVERRSDNTLILSYNVKTNYFYLFGGQDESSQDLVQGVTLAGVFMDEVALQPLSFINQVMGRCSVKGAKYFFNCNPGYPGHWVKKQLIDKAQEKKLLHQHFMMSDNPALSAEARWRYETMYPYMGVFYKRHILGIWCMAEGAIYDSFDDGNLYTDEILPGSHIWNKSSHYIAIDYGTQNAFVMLHIIDYEEENKVFVQKEYYHSGRETGTQKTNSQYADEYERFVKDIPVRKTIIDPSAISFRVELRQRGASVSEGRNVKARQELAQQSKARRALEKPYEVVDGIRLISNLFARKIIKIHKTKCPQLTEEIQGYAWDPKPTEKGKEQPLKRNDHGPDALRYWGETCYSSYRLDYGESV